MSNQNNCTTNRETIAALVLGILEPDAAKEFQKHIETCKKCQSLYYDMLKEEKDIRSALRTIADKSEVLRENLIENLTNNKPQVEPGVKASKRNVEATLAAHKKVIHSTHTKSNIWEIFINSRKIKYGAAAAIFLIILGGLNFWPFNSPDKKQWWLGPSTVWGRDIMMNLNNIETLVFRQQAVFVSPYGSTHVSGTWYRNYVARDRSVKEQYYEETDEDTFGDVKPDSILQNVTYDLPDGNDLTLYDISFEFKCYTVKTLEGAAYQRDPVERLRFYVNLLDKADRILDVETFEGKKCVGFEISASKYGDNPPEYIDRIWFDVQTKLPVRIEEHGRPLTDRPGETLTFIQDQFVYHAHIPGELYEPQIPDDFINAESSEMRKAREEQEKGQMIYANVPPELAAVTAKAMTTFENAAYRQRLGNIEDGTWTYHNRQQVYVSKYGWREDDYYSLQQVQRTNFYITSQSDWGKTSFDFNDKNFSMIQVIVDYRRHTYKTITYGGSSHPDNPMDRIIFLINWFSKADIFFENEEKDGKECYGFELSAKKYGTNPETTKHRLWFDKKTNLPVRIEDEWLEDDGPRKMIKDQFEWNVKLPPDTFIPDIPKDYTPEQESTEK